MNHFFIGALILVCMSVVMKAGDAPPPAEDPKSQNVRVRFIPDHAPTKGFEGTGGSGTLLGPNGPPGGAMIFLGIGKSFPVFDESGQKFELSMPKGDDDHVVLEIKNGEAKQTLDLKRDKPGSVVVAGVTYQISYSSALVARTGPEFPISNQVMLVVSKAKTDAAPPNK